VSYQPPADQVRPVRVVDTDLERLDLAFRRVVETLALDDPFRGGGEDLPDRVLDLGGGDGPPVCVFELGQAFEDARQDLDRGQDVVLLRGPACAADRFGQLAAIEWFVVSRELRPAARPRTCARSCR